MTLRLAGSTSGYTEIDAPAVAGSNTLTLPTGNGTNGQVLQTNGSGALSWVSPIESGALYYRLNADLAGANVTTAQSLFGVGVTLAASTVYAFDATYALTRPSSTTTSHTIGIGYGGTATLNNIFWRGEGPCDTSSIPTARIAVSQTTFISNSAANLTITSAQTSSPVYLSVRVSGTVSINAAGTFIPQYTLSAAPGTAYSTLTGSYIRFVPIGTAGSTSSQGTWS